MSDINKTQEEILRRVEERKRNERREKINAVLDNVAFVVSTPYREAKRFVEDKKKEKEIEQSYQNRMQKEFEDYLALFDESKIGTCEIETLDHGSVIKTTVHTEIGPLIQYRQADTTKTNRVAYMGFAPSAVGKTDYQFLSIKLYQTLRSWARHDEPIEAWFSGVSRDKQGHFTKISSEWERGESHSKEFLKASKRMKTFAQFFDMEKSNAVEYKAKKFETDCSDEMQTN